MSNASKPALPGNLLKAFLAASAIAISVLLAWAPYRTPNALGPDARQDTFSATRAMRHLQTIARDPHPAGSRAHLDIQRYLIAEIEALGLRADVQRATQVSPRVEWMNVAASVVNIATRIEGQGGKGGAVLLMAHYDSVSIGPGANDNGTAVASLLEIARAFRAGQAPRNDVILLFTDAEEDGLLGAEAFVAGHPWAKEIRLVINLEARGTRGPSMLFETRAGNASLINGLRASKPDSVGSSLFYEVYKHLPNDTDYSVFRDKGVAGLNFAYVGGVNAYHSRLDDLASVDVGVVQQHGDNAYAAARHFANADLDELQTNEDAVFFNLPFLGMIAHSATLAMPLAAIAALLVAITWFLAVRRRRVRPRYVTAGIALLPFAAIIVAGVVSLLWYGLSAVWPAQRWMPLGEPYAGAAFFVALLSLSFGLILMVVNRLRRSFESDELWLAALTFWMMLALILSFVWPGASYVAIWPILVCTLVLLWGLMRGADAASKPLAIIVSAFVPAIFIAPLVWLLYLGLTLAVVPVPLVVALLGMLAMLPALEALRSASPRVVSGIPAILALIAIVVLPLVQRFDSHHPRPESLSFVADTTKRMAAWISSDEQAGPWNEQYLGDDAVRSSLNLFGAMGYPFLVGQSSFPEGLLPPSLEVISDRVDDGKRLLKVRVVSQRGGEQLWLNIPFPLRVLSASVEGKPLAASRSGSQTAWSLRYIAPPAEGIVLTLAFEPGKLIEIQAVDRTRGLPVLPPSKQHPRPADTMAPLNFEEFQDSTFVASSIRIPAS